MAAMRLPELALRVCVIPLAVASLWEMATNREVDETYGEVRFSNLSGFTYLVGINAVTAAYAVASILLSSFKSFARYDWLILVLDQNLRSKRNSRPPAAAGWSWRPALCASGRRQSACAKALARCRRCAVAVLRGPRLAGSACAAGLLAAAAVQRCPAPGLPLSGLRSAGRRLAVRRCCAAPRRAARVGSARRCARVVLNRGRGADRWPAGALGCAADCLCDSIQSQRAELVGWARPAQGSGRPACEVDPHLELATGSNRFDPEQKRSKRVVTPSTRGDPRVDPPSASPLVCSAPPPPPLPIVTNQIELVADQISIPVAQLLPSRSGASFPRRGSSLPVAVVVDFRSATTPVVAVESPLQEHSLMHLEL